MPVLFFVTGASNSMKPISSWRRFITLRWTRMLFSYWIYAAMCVVLSTAAYLYGTFGTADTSITHILKIFVSWILPVDRQISHVSYLTYALWFVPVYLIVILLIPVFQLLKKKNKWLTGIGLVSLSLLADAFSLGWIQNIFFYGVWTYFGLFYREILDAMKVRRYRRYSLGLVFALFSILAIMAVCGISLNMQKNKFPPNSPFFIYSTAMVLLVLINHESILSKANLLYNII